MSITENLHGSQTETKSNFFYWMTRVRQNTTPGCIEAQQIGLLSFVTRAEIDMCSAVTSFAKRAKC